MISVIVPYYNARPWLDRCCQSLADNAGDFEFLMVDDNSQDDGAEVVAKFAAKDSRFVPLTNTGGKGVSGARNTGLDNARGEWITFVDADDELAPDAFRAFNEAIRGGQYNIYQFDHFRYYAKIDKMTVKYRNKPGEYTISDRPILFCMVWNKLYKAELLRDIKFDEEVSYCEDELFNLECIAKDNRVYCISDETVIHHFENPQSLTKSTTPEQLFLQTEKLAEFIKRQSDPIIKIAVCLSLSEHWQSNKYLDIIGERQKIGGDNGKE